MTEGYQFRLKEIAGIFTVLRDNLRNGKSRVYWDQPNALRREVASALGIKPEDFSTAYFHSSTLDRLAVFFAVPKGPNLNWRWPTQDEVAWALQNFINRRSRPWEFFENKMKAQNAVDTADEAFTDDTEQLIALGDA